jgi:hypothetical protein
VADRWRTLGGTKSVCLVPGCTDALLKMRFRKFWWDEIMRPMRRAASVRTRDFCETGGRCYRTRDPVVRLPKIHPSQLTSHLFGIDTARRNQPDEKAGI